ncbi:hypothetical protein Poli38472_000989 [Pythium oligandrum]|uniref:EF-hand domain-containing protein n=1 Tax=Pythium oligandrum TaxID=41045 RepID=A0A8K1FIP2_PYTOL|nr:hypothetical protein Poli38472_000989 [Pythium oligandrum]|eukprot:TMW60947.1 hypothetical protein Poli38472_000989 [Pythium oligandrum]
MAGDGDENAGSLFRIGYNVELSRVLDHLCLLVLFVIIFELFLHRLEHHLKKSPKYHEMLTKTLGELMILGFIGLAVKLVKELGHLDPYSKDMIAIQAADILVFVLAIALILQAMSIYLQLRRENIQADKADLASSSHLVEMIKRHRADAATQRQNIGAKISAYCRTVIFFRPDKKSIEPADFREVVETRILRHFFLKTHKLPELFPFSKYLRQAQDNQINHMIEVEVSTWMILLFLGFVLAKISDLLEADLVGLDPHFAIVAGLFGLMWIAVALHIFIYVYFTWALKELLDAAVGSDALRVGLYEKLQEIALDEATAVNEQETGAMDVIAAMENVREENEMEEMDGHHHYHDTGFQLFMAAGRKFMAKLSQPPPSSVHGPATIDSTGNTAFEEHPKSRREVKIRWFHRDAWHFIVMSSLMLNGFCFALFCQCVLYQMHRLADKFGITAMVFIPIPLLINMIILQPRIIRDYILVSSVYRVDGAALGDVIDHFTETVQLRTELMHTVNEYCARTGHTIANIQMAFESRDPGKTGFLEIDQLRRILGQYGFKLSFFRFNSVAKLLFQLHGTKVEYAQVLKLLSLGQHEEARSLYGGSMVLISSEGTVEHVNAGPHLMRSQRGGAVPQAHSPRDMSMYLRPQSMVYHPDSSSMLIRASSAFMRSVYHLEDAPESRRHLEYTTSLDL